MGLRYGWRLVLAVFTVIAMGSCTKNIFVDAANKETDAALVFKAKQYINSQDWGSAISTLALLSTDAKGLRTNKMLFASAYAGRCGLNFIDAATTLSGLSGRLFPYLTNAYKAATLSKVTDCLTAEGYVLSISNDASLRTADENMFMVLLGFLKMGSILAAQSDINDDGTIVSGAPDNFDPCAAAGTLSDYYAAHVGTGLTNAMLSLSAMGSTLAGGTTTSFATVCAGLVLLGYDFCSKVVVSQFSATDIKGVRSLIKEDSSLGIGTCVGDISVCNCP